jgi:membrane carboxypeptidase/penicillin-binding protein PbpC
MAERLVWVQDRRFYAHGAVDTFVVPAVRIVAYIGGLLLIAHSAKLTLSLPFDPTQLLSISGM